MMNRLDPSGRLTRVNPDRGGPGPTSAGQPFNSDGVLTSRSAPTQALAVRTAVMDEWPKRDESGAITRPGSFAAGVALASEGARALLETRANLLSATRGARAKQDAWGVRVLDTLRAEKVAPTAAGTATSRAAISQIQANAALRANHGDVEGALTLVNDSLREILNVRAVGVGNVARTDEARIQEARDAIGLVRALDPAWSKAKYNEACLIARTEADAPTRVAEACTLIFEAIRDAAKYGVDPRAQLAHARTKDADWEPIRRFSGFQTALDRAEATLEK